MCVWLSDRDEMGFYGWLAGWLAESKPLDVTGFCGVRIHVSSRHTLAAGRLKAVQCTQWSCRTTVIDVTDALTTHREGQTDGQTDTQTPRQRDRQTDPVSTTHTHTHLLVCRRKTAVTHTPTRHHARLD
mmetsp:Transcript_17109/g.41086  ORF Transcript_17109/g.41086 Transcript_17109/m.41086 type:complete len:129 (+) Transcript_17109:112-498(+)